MSHIRTALRDEVRSALSIALPGIDWRRAHWQVVDAELPVGAVATPRTLTDRESVDDVTRRVDMVVVVKMTGPDTLEDDLDALSVDIEEAVLPVLPAFSDEFDLAEENTDVSFEGETPVGKLSVLFRVMLRTPEADPNTP